MTEREASLEELALRLMCRPESIPKHVIQAMSGEDLSQVLEWAMEHRFAPCLHYNMGKAGLLPLLPAEMRDRIAIAYQRATLRGLSMQRDMIRTSRILEQAGIAHLFMKGAYVAQFAYPELGLRPLRDIDVLVPHAQAIAGFEALQASGLERKPGHPGDPAAHLEDRKHLPPLRIPGGATVEVHTRTISPSLLLRTDSAQGIYETMAPRQIRRDVADCSIPFEGTEDLLLHLAVHAAIDHQFNNGPLIVSDIGWLLETHAISWPRLWQLASAQGATRGLALVLRLIEREWPDASIEWDAETASILAPQDPIITVAARSLLRSFEARGDVALQAELAGQLSTAARLRILLRRAFPRRADLATEVPVSAASPWIIFWYPLKWWRLRLRLADFMRSRRDRRARQDAARLGTLTSWLRG
ncbi:MAG: nucleotidyltransferase family protein [Minwuia sp.]|nr:nucleotidyltransferase family protein [Minwuia sp.]